MSLISVARDGILRFIEILVKSLRIAGYGAKVASTTERDIVEGLERAIGIEVSDLSQADIVLKDVGFLGKAPINFVEKLGNNSLLMIQYHSRYQSTT